MAERKKQRPRKCEKCGDEITTDAEGIKRHWERCPGKAGQDG